MHQFPTTSVEFKNDTFVLTLGSPDGLNTFTARIPLEKAEPEWIDKMINRLLLMYTDNARHKLLTGVYAIKKDLP